MRTTDKRRRRPSLAPRKLTNTIIGQFVEHCGNGAGIWAVAEFLGISGPRLLDWIRKGELYLNGDEEPEDFYLCGKLVRELKRATGYDLIRLETAVRDETADAAARMVSFRLLERIDRNRYGREVFDGGNDDQYDEEDTFL